MTWIRRIPFKKLLLVFFLFLVLVVLGLYWILSSETALRWALERVNQSVPGEIGYDTLSIRGRKISMSGLYYQSPKGPALSVGDFELSWSLAPLFRGQVQFNNLKVNGLILDLTAFPKKERVSLDWRNLLRLLLNRLSLEKGEFSGLRLKIKEDTELFLDAFSLTLTPQILENQSFALSSQGGYLALGKESIGLQDFKLDGNVDIPVLGTNRFFVEEALVLMKLEGLGWREWSLNQFEGIFELEGELTSIEEGKFKSDYGSFNLAGQMDWKNLFWSFQTKSLSAIELAKVPKVKDRVYNIFQKIGWDIQAQGKNLSLKKMEGDLDLKVFAQTPQDNYQLKAQGPIKKGTWSWKDFTITSNQSRAKITGSMDLAQAKVDAQVQVTNLKIENIVQAVSDLEISGIANGQGRIWGLLKGPNFDFKAQGREAAYQFLHFGANVGEFKIINGDLSYVGKAPAASGYEASVEVRTKEIFKPSRRTQLKSRFSAIKASELLDDPKMKGLIQGSFDMQVWPAGKPGRDVPSNKKGLLKAQIKQAEVYGFFLDEVQVEGALANQEFRLDPVRFKPKAYEWQKVPEPTVFTFGEKGWGFKGMILSGFEVEGQGGARHPEKVVVKGTFKNAELRPLLAALNFPTWESYGTGDLDMEIGVEGRPSRVDVRLQDLRMPIEEGGELRILEPAEIKIRPPTLELKPVRLSMGDRFFEMSGSYRFGANFAMKVEGNLPLALLNLFPQNFREGKGYASGLLKLGGTYDNPSLSGELDFLEASLRIRDLGLELNNLAGRLILNPDKFVFDKFKAQTQQGDLELSGEVKVKGVDPLFYDLKILAREVVIKEPGVYVLIFSGEFGLEGPADSALLSGAMDINEGIYRQDFDVTSFLFKSETPLPEEDRLSFLDSFNLDLSVSSPGELALKNNVAEFFFNADLIVRGTFAEPQIAGAVEVLEGRLQYFTVAFEAEEGRVEFRENKPYVDIWLRRDLESRLETFVIRAHVQGFADNLRLEFTSDPPLDQQNLLALVLTGAPPGQARTLSGSELASSVVASQLTSILAKPLERTFKLDVFRLEGSDPRKDTFSTLVVGKKLTDRLSFNFRTDLSADEAVQGIQMEYLLLDNVLIKASQFSDGDFDINLGLRFQFF